MKATLENDSCLVTVDLHGGAFTSFILKGRDVNPLNFAFTNEQMPVNNRSGAPYQGHFLCAGRWGPPSAGEVRAGIPDHGEIANISWEKIAQHTRSLEMRATAHEEGLQVSRAVIISSQNPVIRVSETLTNIHRLGRLYNVVQHPTLSAPFLTDATVVDTNAITGFDQAFYRTAGERCFSWPFVRDNSDVVFDLHTPVRCYNSVYSFIVDRESRYGWITAYSPEHRMVLGYLWDRADYPWVHLWQHWESGVLKYRGIEFGTAGIHQPFDVTIETAWTLFGEKTCRYIDAGNSVSASYFSFVCPVDVPVKGVKSVHRKAGSIEVHFRTGTSGSYTTELFTDGL